MLVGAGLAGWSLLGRSPPREVAAMPQPRATGPAAASFGATAAAGLQTPFGDALFRWRCTSGLAEALGERPAWPLRRVAGFCLCVADRLREDGLRDIVVGSGDLAAALEAAEARLCRRD